MCEFCEAKEPIKSNWSEYRIEEFGRGFVLTCKLNNCPPYADCSRKGMNIKMAGIINYCPICGKRLTEEEKDPINICKKEKMK